VKWAQWEHPIQRTVRSVHMCVHCTVHNTAQNRPDNFPSYPPDNHHCSDDVYLREGGTARSFCVRSKTLCILRHDMNIKLQQSGGFPPCQNFLIRSVRKSHWSLWLGGQTPGPPGQIYPCPLTLKSEKFARITESGAFIFPNFVKFTVL